MLYCFLVKCFIHFVWTFLFLVKLITITMNSNCNVFCGYVCDAFQ